MELFSNMRTRVGAWSLRKTVNSRKRHKKVFNLHTARSIGILYDATNHNYFEPVLKFAKELKDNNSEVSVLGFINSKDVPDKYLFKKGYAYFNKSEMNWYYKPTSEDAISFMNLKLDILIDLNLERSLLFDFIVATSLARFKVGRYRKDCKYYDFMIQIKNDPTFEYFIQQVKHYLEMINRPELSPNFENI